MRKLLLNEVYPKKPSIKKKSKLQNAGIQHKMSHGKMWERRLFV